MEKIKTQPEIRIIQKFVLVCLVALVLLTAFSLFDNQTSPADSLLIMSFNLAILVGYYWAFIRGYQQFRSRWQGLDFVRRVLFGLLAGALYLILAGAYLLYLPSSIVYQTAILFLVPVGVLAVLVGGAIGQGLVVSLATLIMSLVFIEIFLHVVPIFDIVGKQYLDYNDVYQNPPDAPFWEGGHLKPDLDVWVVGEMGQEQVHFVTNSKGFRNEREFDRYSLPDTYRIIYLGDSFVAGYRIGQEETSGYVLQNNLAGQPDQAGLNDQVEVLTALLKDTSVATRWLEAYGLAYQPDLIIMGVTLGNDVAETCVWQEPTFAGFSVPPLNGLYLPDDAFAMAAWLNLANKYKFTSLGSLMTRTLYANEVGIASSYPDTKAGKLYVFDLNNGLGLFYTPPTEEVSLCFDHFQAQLAAIRQLVEASGAEILVVLFPQRYQVNEREWQITRRRYLLNSAHFDLEQPNRLILSGCEQAGVSCFDLLPAFREAGYDPLYMPRGDMHWNVEGNRVAGEAIADYVWHHYLQNKFFIKE